jgi:tRNA-2-methylthio-N6-dimethylallyladenosine synthase
MNEHDSERMKGMLESLGYAESPDRGQADLVLFNTCSIRESRRSGRWRPTACAR